MKKVEGESDTSQLVVEDLKKLLQEREQALKEAQQDRDTLGTELEELDRQNQEATQVSLIAAASQKYN